ncbi:hypothetical protein H634G_08726 [Metarhizium anisopliae BRIP 53293]|uniref:INO80 complex subunit 4 n=1 Tax=Metarhizium anisopliae BRIP 53293 TaxID=1291518 RepID=A0A0D9NTK3_METAN|nr:hypothetical protein H634G_08726 [Metarhizium anisopliae BRIP 53293]KJK87594.1 hypothetical protein H633G_08557 [Metarhizium anisopliae BRIP 53284]
MPPKADGRRKSGSKTRLVVTLKIAVSRLREVMHAESPDAESPTPKESSEPKDSPAPSAHLAVSGVSNGDNASDSNAATPAAEGTPAPASMAPPTDGRKKGAKRSAATIDGVPKPRGKPGPKKKPRLEDGTIDHAAVARMQAAKLGPKANQGAINAGLRALDRSGKPCRKWARGGFKLKSFTGVVWEIPRWTAPNTKKSGEDDNDESGAASASADNSSGKENKANGQEENSANNSNAGGDVEMNSAPSINASSPAPIAISAAS